VENPTATVWFDGWGVREICQHHRINPINHPQNPHVTGLDFNHTRFSMVGLVGIRAYHMGISWDNEQIGIDSDSQLLVGGFNHLEKYEFVNGKDDPIYYGKNV